MANTKILIVDDDLNISELLRLCLEKEGYDTIIANGGSGAMLMSARYNDRGVLYDLDIAKENK